MIGMVINLIISLLLVMGGMPFVQAKSKDAKANKTATRAKNKKDVQAKTTPKTRTAGSNADRRFEDMRRSYRQGDRESGRVWSELQGIDTQLNDLNRDNQIALLQIESDMLLRAGYPYLSAMYSAEAMKRAPAALSSATKSSWLTLWQASQKRPMQNLLEDLAGRLNVAQPPPGFGTSWYYYKGNAAQAKGNANEAIANYDKLRINDYHFLSAKYQVAMIHLANERQAPAELALKTMLNSVPQTMAPLPLENLKEMSNYAKLALARLYYQQKDFKAAIKFFRAVDRDSKLFYDALFEQSWAFFMAGYPNHALGALHSVESPFFKDVFNPEASVLRAITYYWMCRYDDSKAALANFNERHGEAVESLGNFLARKRLSDDTAYQLFENFVSGVSAQSLGMPKSVLNSAATEESMMLLRDQYAGLVTEQDRIEAQGVFGSRNVGKPKDLLNRQLKAFRKGIGEQYIVELQSLKKHFDRLYEQSQFLYVELLMSEKEQLLGRELHASSKIDHISQKKNIAGWGDKTQAWGDNKLNEFWWDEVGFYIYNVQPMCKTGG